MSLGRQPPMPAQQQAPKHLFTHSLLKVSLETLTLFMKDLGAIYTYICIYYKLTFL